MIGASDPISTQGVVGDTPTADLRPVTSIGVLDMSLEDAKKFLDQVDQSSALQQRLQEHKGQLVSIGQEHGFSFTQDELHDELRDRWAVSKPKDDPDTCTLG